MMRTDNNSLKQKTISGLFWSFFDLVFSQGIKFVIQVILARMLMPEDFGIIAMISFFIAVSQTIVDCGFQKALIRETNSTQKDYSTAFYFNMIVAIFLYILLVVIAPKIGQFYHEPELVPILKVLAVVVIINSFGLIQRTILIKKIDFKTLTRINIVSSLVSGTIAVTSAYIGLGVWSLVIQNVIMQFIQMVMLFLSNRWMPSMVFSLCSFKRLFGFGWKLLVSGLISTLYENIYYIIIGRYFSAVALGYYTNAQKLRDMVSHSITLSIEKVSYPALSSIKDDEARLRRGYRKIIKNSVFITFPVMLGLAAVAEPFIVVIFGVKWFSSIQYFQILCFAGMLYPLHAINLNILQVKGRSDLFLFLEILKKAIFTVFIVIVIVLELGILGLLWAAAANSYIAYFINANYSGKQISYSIKDQLKDILPIGAAAAIMSFIVYNIGLFLEYGYAIELIIQAFSGIVVYIFLSYLFKIEELKQNKELIVMLVRNIRQKI